MDQQQQDEIRKIARKEVASLCGLVLRRMETIPEGTFSANSAVRQEIASVFGEALRDFGSTETEPGRG